MRPSSTGSTDHLRKGREAEDRALSFLQQQGLRYVDRNFRTRCGEIDLVMDDSGILVFVEVRYRQHRGYGGAIESIDRAKCARLVATAQWYLNAKRVRGPARFDVVALELQATGATSVVWIKDAIRDA